MLNKLLSYFIAFFSITLLILVHSTCPAREGKLRDATWQRTFELYRDIPCLTEEEIEYGSEIITGLSYNSSRAFRQLCQMEGMNFAKSKKAWADLISLGLSYEQMLAFEKWSYMGQIHIDIGLEAIQKISLLN